MTDALQQTPRRIDTADSQTVSECPECGGTPEQDGHEVVCTACGAVVEAQTVDPGAYGDHFDRTPHFQQVDRTHHDKALGSTFDSREGEWDPRQAGRLQQQHTRAKTRSKRERNQISAIVGIKRITAELELSREIQERAVRLFRDAQDANCLVGRSIEEFVAGTVYAVAREQGQTVRPEQVAEHSSVDASTVVHALRTLVREVDVEVPPFTPADHVPAICSDLDLPASVATDAIRLARAAQSAGLTTGVSPSGFAAGVVYRVLDREFGRPHPNFRTQEAIADTADTTPVTLRKHAKAVRDL